MDNNAVIDALVGGAMPLLIAVINQSYWSPKIKALVALVSCVAAATVAAVLRDAVDWVNWRESLVLILGAALASYRWLWQPSTIAPTVEAVTTVTPDAVESNPEG